MYVLWTADRRALAVTLLVLASGYWAWNARSSEGGLYPAKGDIVIAVTSTTDTPVATALLLSVQRVELRTAADDRATIMTSGKTFNILHLKSQWQSTHLATASIPAGKYEQLRLLVSRVQISTEDGSIAQANMPANEIVINGPIIVTPRDTTVVTLDFLADASVHKTKDGVYIFTPAIEMTHTTNAAIKRVANSTIMTTGGTSTTMRIGMDLKGEMKSDFQLPPDTTLQFKRGVITLNQTKTKKVK